MSDRHIFADEAGCMTFSRKQGASRYFIVCTVVTDDLSLGTEVTSLRKKLVWDRVELGEYFHATTDKQAVRNAMFEVLAGAKFSIQAQILDKPKAQPQIAASPSRFYQHAWYWLFKYGTRKQIPIAGRVLITAASIGQKKERGAFREAIEDVMYQTMSQRTWATDQVPAASDPCLQVADYCAWAIQRKYETGDERSYALIKDKITYEVDVWKHGKTEHY